MTEPTASVALLLATTLFVLVMSDLPCYTCTFGFCSSHSTMSENVGLILKRQEKEIKLKIWIVMKCGILRGFCEV